jgi:hypothetical protein
MAGNPLVYGGENQKNVTVTANSNQQLASSQIQGMSFLILGLPTANSQLGALPRGFHPGRSNLIDLSLIELFSRTLAGMM